MHAVVDRLASGTGAPAWSPPPLDERTELLIVDTSGSMDGKKLRAAKAATAAAIDCIPDGVRFGIITGNHQAEVAYPLVAAGRVLAGDTAGQGGGEAIRGRGWDGHG